MGSPIFHPSSRAMATAEYAHISLSADGVPILSGTRTKVVLIVIDHVGRGLDAHEIRREYPHLSLGQIHSALAYYYDHKEEMDAEVRRSQEFADEMKAKLGPGPVTEKLRATGRLP